MSLTDTGAWSADWVWGIALILTTIVTHVVCIGFINEKITVIANDPARHHRPRVTFFLIVGTVTILLALLLGAEGAAWALVYRFLDALPDFRSAMLYSIGAMTSYGHADVLLASEWQMMGPLEALNGMLLFGLTAAFLYAVMQKCWLIKRH